MEDLMYEEIFVKTDRSHTGQTDEVIETLAGAGHPAAKLIKAIIDAMNGNNTDIMNAVFKALDDVDNVYGDGTLYNQVWFYFTGQDNEFTDFTFVSEFLYKLAKSLFEGSNGFPVHKELSCVIMKDVRRSVSWSGIIA